MSDFSQFPARLRLALEQNKVSSLEAADHLEISVNTFQKYLDGEIIPALGMLYKIAKLLNTTMEWLLTGTSICDNCEAMINKSSCAAS